MTPPRSVVLLFLLATLVVLSLTGAGIPRARQLAADHARRVQAKRAVIRQAIRRTHDVVARDPAEAAYLAERVRLLEAELDKLD